MIAAEGYVHLQWLNAVADGSIAEFRQNLKGDMYLTHIQNSLQKQWSIKFRSQRSRTTFYGSKQDINSFLKRTQYGRTIAQSLNTIMNGMEHGFTSAREFMAGTSFSDYTFSNPEEVQQALINKINEGAAPISGAATELRNMSQELDSIFQNLGDYIVSLLLLEDKTADELDIIQYAIQLKNREVIEIPSNIGEAAKIAIKDFNRMVESNNNLINYANALSAIGNVSDNIDLNVADEFKGIGRFLNTFGGFVGEVAAYAGLYSALTKPELQNQMKATFHTGDKNILSSNFLQINKKEHLDPNFLKFFEHVASLADGKKLKDDVELLWSTDKVIGTVGLNIKNTSEINAAGKVRRYALVTLDSSDTLASLIAQNVSYGTIPAEMGDPNFYHNLAAALPYNVSRKEKKGQKVYNNLTTQWNNYLNLIANGNALTALMGRLNNMAASAGNNALIFVIDGQYIAIDEIMEKLVEAAKSGRLYIKSQKTRTGAGLHRSVAEQINLSNFQTGKESTEILAQRRSDLVSSALDTQFFSQTLKTKIDIAFFINNGYLSG